MGNGMLCRLGVFYEGIVVLCLGIAGCSGIIANQHADHRRPSSRYPQHWWEPIPKDQGASWEILPQEATPGEVILSKRNELGMLSNFVETPFLFHGKQYRSVEGFWQMMKYPENPLDPRANFPGINWKFTREQVAQMVAFQAKRAGDLASENMKRMGIDWVTFEGRRLKYRTQEKGEHYDLIVEVTRAKIRQNPQARHVLLSTGDLILRPDHHQPPDAPPAWRYHEILMMIRTELSTQAYYDPPPICALARLRTFSPHNSSTDWTRSLLLCSVRSIFNLNTRQSKGQAGFPHHQ